MGIEILTRAVEKSAPMPPSGPVSVLKGSLQGTEGSQRPDVEVHCPHLGRGTQGPLASSFSRSVLRFEMEPLGNC